MRTTRSGIFSQLLKAAPVIIVNSQNVKADLAHYYGPERAEIIALPFAASPDPSWFDVEPDTLVRKYRLPRTYFLCSNQFWKHKNQAVILDALGIAKAQDRTFHVVFTGDTHDFSASDHFDKLVECARGLGVVQNCHFLGLLPKLDQIGLMRSAVAVIQPSLFEGGPGGGAVHDAIAIGQRTIVSDIPVNREIEQYVDEYFPPTNSQALYLAMCRAEAQPPLLRAANVLLTEGLKRRRQCGEVLRSAFALAIELSQPARRTAVAMTEPAAE